MVARDEAEWHRLIRSALDLARAEHTGRIAVEKQAQQHFRCVGFPAARPVMGIQSREVKQRHAVYHEAGQMLGGTDSRPAAPSDRAPARSSRFSKVLLMLNSIPSQTEGLLLSDKLLESNVLSPPRYPRKNDQVNMERNLGTLGS